MWGLNYLAVDENTQKAHDMDSSQHILAVIIIKHMLSGFYWYFIKLRNYE